MLLRNFIVNVVAAGSAIVSTAPAGAVAFHVDPPEVGPSGPIGDSGLRNDQQLLTSFNENEPIAFDPSRSSGFGYFTGSQTNVAAAPLGDASRYVAIGTGGSMMFDLRSLSQGTNALASFSVYAGSIDIYNFVDVLGLNDDGSIDYDRPLFTVGGQDLIGVGNDHPNGRLTLGFDEFDKVGGVVFRSTGVAFEFDTIGVSTMLRSSPTLAAGAVPEPASWAMMVGGFGVIGGALRNRRRLGISFG